MRLDVVRSPDCSACGGRGMGSLIRRRLVVRELEEKGLKLRFLSW